MTVGTITLSAAGQRAEAPRRSLRLAGALVSVAFCLTALGLVGVCAFVSHANPLAIGLSEQLHLLANIICVGFITVTAWRTRGEVEQKLAQVLTTAIVIYGLTFLVILGGRLFFSRGLILTSFSASVALGFATVLLKHGLSRPRIGVVGPLVSLGPDGRAAGELISDPNADLRQFDVLLVGFSEAVDTSWARSIARAMLSGTTVRHVGEYLEQRRGVVALEHFDVEQVPDFSLASYRHLKRFIDVAAVLLTLPVTLPIVLISGTLIIVSTAGSPLFLQERIGLGGRIFRIWKLRTMRDAPHGPGPLATQPNDARITAVGRILRRLHIDELPQLWNVLKGDMTLIGPRPEAVALHDSYLRQTPAWTYRTLVRPGITGWAQVCAAPSTNVEEARRKLTYDLYYVKRMSLLLDLQIALRTSWTVMGGAKRNPPIG